MSSRKVQSRFLFPLKRKLNFDCSRWLSIFSADCAVVWHPAGCFNCWLRFCWIIYIFKTFDTFVDLLGSQTKPSQFSSSVQCIYVEIVHGPFLQTVHCHMYKSFHPPDMRGEWMIFWSPSDESLIGMSCEEAFCTGLLPCTVSPFSSPHDFIFISIFLSSWTLHDSVGMIDGPWQMHP